MSVILPCRRSDHLESQLHAVTSQKLGAPWELIVVDNGAASELGPLVERFTSDSPPVHLVRASARVGPGYARNVGAAAAAGSVLVFCDADDVCGDGWLDALMAGIDDAELVGGPLVEWASAAAAVGEGPAGVGEGPAAAGAGEGIPKAFGVVSFFPTANFAIRRATFDELGGFDEWFDQFGGCEDVDLCWRAAAAGDRLALAPGALVFHRRREGAAALVRQQYRNGRAELAFATAYAPHGLVRSLRRYEVRRFAFMVRHLPDVVRSPRARRKWVTWLAKRVGWVAFMVSAAGRAGSRSAPRIAGDGLTR